MVEPGHALVDDQPGEALQEELIPKKIYKKACLTS